MRTKAIAILGLVAAATALPAATDMARPVKRQEQSVRPLQREAIERGIAQIENFLAQYGGSAQSEVVEGPDGASSTIQPGKKAKRGGGHGHDKPEDMFLILDQWTVLTKERYTESHPPPTPVYLVACQLAQLLIEEGFDIDTKILDAWSHFQVADRKLKTRQEDGIFALPGSCNIDDIIGLETILATIMLIYGESPPAHIKSLRNAVTAALLFCGAADAVSGGMVPDRPSSGGGQVVPDRPSQGSPVVPDVPSQGGQIVPDVPEAGGRVTPDVPSAGGRVIPDVPSEGGSVVPDMPSEGGRVRPSD